MKKWSLFAVLSLGLMMVTLVPAAQAVKDDEGFNFKLENRMPQPITGLWYSDHGKNDWIDYYEELYEFDMVEDIAVGKVFEMFLEEVKPCQDLRIETKDKKVYVWKQGFDVNKLVSLKVSLDAKGKPVATATPANAQNCK